MSQSPVPAHHSVQSGGASVVFDHVYNVGQLQVVCKDLGNAGTWGVDALFDDDTWREVQATNLALVGVFTTDKIVRALRVKFANLAPGDNPIATLSVVGRTLRHSVA